MFNNFYRDKKVLVTGDTGFKGSWLCLWLRHMGAKVYGISLAPNTTPSNYEILNLDDEIEHYTIDIKDYKAFSKQVKEIRPEVVFHLAAQPLVRLSYECPLETLETNVTGSANLLESLKLCQYSSKEPCAVVMVTSDKCYENHEILSGYREDEAMGGHDVYSMSKGAAELVIASWRRSFFPPNQWEAHGVSIASARAGNVIGGGDWAADRIVVDCMAALANKQAIEVRNPGAVRPWQHLLDPLSGYLQLAAEMSISAGERNELCSAFNFGPGRASECSVKDLVETALKYWPGKWTHIAQVNAVHEANYLKLSTDKAWHSIGWQSVWDFDTCIKNTVLWYKLAFENNYDKKALKGLSILQIEAYFSAAKNQKLCWATSM